MATPLTSQSRLNLLSVYVTDLELEVDRLRKQLQLVCQVGRDLCVGETSGEGATRRQNDFLSLLEGIQVEVQSPLVLDRIVPIDMRELIDSVFRWQQRMENRPQTRLVLELDCQRINWFPVRLRHILQNLISNAVKYSDLEKGEGRVSVVVKSVPGGYELRVTDNGVGMPQKQVLNLLEPMHRACSRQGSELGVGVAIVKHLVEQSGGELNVDSGSGMGSCFVVTLPTYAQGDFLN